ncbi:TetR family transcriptional regulator [Gracilibacillus salitolerans]|uniref:TetR family transcriptional regulator n=1 Tax=Gracilibacillus salitolerans TaxID=2663022 RepID=A0A5Q2TT37_9BACI|nr:TetR/AcrR family transcriptional regulator [Gracilibacillus salitolerans]QGH35948.1 TetR family transcriptional regulator [Gracilibacillus salitolerans]
MNTYVNPNDPRVKRTRKFLQHAFLELLDEKDFQAITIQDITERAEVNRSTFYHHFQDKYELLDLTIGSMFSDILSKWIPEDKEMSKQTLVRNLMLAVCQWQVETGKHINRKMSLSATIEKTTIQHLYTIIVSCLKQTELKTVKDQRKTEVTATMISWSIYGIVFQWVSNQETESAEELVDLTLPFILACLYST